MIGLFGELFQAVDHSLPPVGDVHLEGGLELAPVACGDDYTVVGSDQAEAVKTLLQEAGYENIEVKKDLAGLDRVVIGRLNNIN